MNYFELYGMPLSFLVNEDEVRRKYFELSRKSHPDLFANSPEAEQQKALEQSTINTRAFQTLADFDRRMKYILELKTLIYEGERYELPPEFLMEMMEVNEELMELNEENKASLKNKVEGLMRELYNGVHEDIEQYLDEQATAAQLQRIKDYYYKKKYLLRLKERLDSFGGS